MSKEETIRVKQFKDGSNNWWCSYVHYTLIDNNIICVAGGEDTKERREAIEKYLKRKKII